MRIENQALKRLISNNPLAETYAKEGFMNMGEALDEKVADYLYNQILDYSKLEVIKDKIFSGRDISDKLEVAIDVMPGLAFSVPARFKVEGRPGLALKQLQIAVLDSAMNRFRESQVFINAFLSAIPFSSTAEEVGTKLAKEGGDETFLPRQAMFEFGQVAQGLLSRPVGAKRPEQIENYYIFQAYSQIFFNFYLELLLKAPSGVVLGVVQAVFAYILAALRRFEINHFHQPGQPTVEQLDLWIDRDGAQARHPNLRKHIFGYVGNYCPIVKTGAQQSLSATGQRILHNQLESFKKADPERLALIFMDLRKFRGNGAVMFILGQMQRNYLEVIQRLNGFISGSDDPNNGDLKKMVSLVLPKEKVRTESSGMVKHAGAIESQASIRRARAKKNLAEVDHEKAMTFRDVEGYLKDRLEKLYARVKKEGALTKDKIPGYLAQFTDSSGEILSGKKVSAKDVAQFTSGTQGIIEEMGADGGLTAEEIEQKKQRVEELGTQLAGAETEEAKAELLSEIGGELMDAQDAVDAKLPEEERRDLEFEKIRDSQIISIGVERNCPMVTVGEFFSFPLGVKGEMEEGQWFRFHLKYLDLLESDKILPPEKRSLIDEIYSKFEKIEYKKYFDIFPNEKFDDSILSAVYSLWENNGLERLRIEKTS